MNTIKFIKILEYKLKPDKGNVFEYIDGLLSQRINPPSLNPQSLSVNADVVFHSPLRRAVECIQKKKGSRYISTPLLAEIPFSPKKFLAEKEWEKEKSAAIRKKFKEAFIKDQLLVKRKRVLEDTEKLLKTLYQRGVRSSLAVVSHSFRLKVIETFIKTQGAVSKKPQLIGRFIFDNQKTYEFGKGFLVSREELKF